MVAGPGLKYQTVVKSKKKFIFSLFSVNVNEDVREPAGITSGYAGYAGMRGIGSDIGC